MKKTTLIYIEKDDKYLMLHRNKKVNDINKDKWIGVGGHVEENETIDECVVREVKEETDLDLISYKLRGEVLFVLNGYEELMYVYTSNEFQGVLKECNEGTLEWIDKNKISKFVENFLIFIGVISPTISIITGIILKEILVW